MYKYTKCTLTYGMHQVHSYTCIQVPVDYSGHMLGDGASMSDKWEDMETNDKITVPMVQAVLNGDTAYLTASCARSSAMVESGAVRCSGRAIRSGKHDNVLVHLNGHGGSNDVDLGPLGDAQLNSLFLGDTHYPDSLSKMPWCVHPSCVCVLFCMLIC